MPLIDLDTDVLDGSLVATLDLIERGAEGHRKERGEILQMDFIRTARAKGLSERTVIQGHALRNALIPVVTVIGVTFAILIGGAIVTEVVFNIPGLGRLLISGILRRDYPVVQGAVLFITVTYVVINLLVDLTYAFT
jgi:peptide/nickel transport system permease protein